MLAMTCTVDDYRVLVESYIVGIRQRVDIELVVSVEGFPSTIGPAGKRPEFYIKSPLGAQLLIYHRGNFLMSFSQGDTSARQLEFFLS